MYRFIPFFIFIAAMTYLFYSPSPMDEIGKTVKTRNSYHLKLMDQERLSISSAEGEHDFASKTAQKPEGQEITSINDPKANNLRLAMSQQDE